jgi:hypothetical protein
MQTDTAVRYLAEGRNALVHAIDGLSEAQLRFTIGPDRWSIADVVEHLARVEAFFVQRVAARLTELPAAPPDRRLADDRVVAWERDPANTVVVPGRVSLGIAPPPIRPAAGWPVRESLDRFLADRERTAAFVQSAPGLRDHAFEHPALGPMDGYQWALFIAAHTTRHLTQIAAIKTDERFPCATCS